MEDSFDWISFTVEFYRWVSLFCICIVLTKNDLINIFSASVKPLIYNLSWYSIVVSITSLIFQNINENSFWFSLFTNNFNRVWLMLTARLQLMQETFFKHQYAGIESQKICKNFSITFWRMSSILPSQTYTFHNCDDGQEVGNISISIMCIPKSPKMPINLMMKAYMYSKHRV